MFTSERMFKRRIQKWELDKNHKEHQMLAIVDLAKRRKADGRSPLQAVRMGHRTIPWSEVERYFRRKGVKDLETLPENPSSSIAPCILAVRGSRNTTHDQMRHSTIEESCSAEPVASATPQQPPSPPYRLAPRRQSSLSLTTTQMGSIDHPLSLTADERMAQAVIGQMQQFYSDWFDAQPNFRTRMTRLPAVYLGLTVQRLMSGAFALKFEYHNAAFRILDSGFATISLWAKAVDPAALIVLLQLVKYLITFGMETLARQLLVYVSHLSEIYHGKGHPLHTITNTLLGAEGLVVSQLITKNEANIAKLVETGFGMSTNHPDSPNCFVRFVLRMAGFTNLMVTTSKPSPI
jgi:hypothetical protein